MNLDLFPDPQPKSPLAERLRPRVLGEIEGQEHLTAPGKLLHAIDKGAALPSMILWGPPGSGKTTLARVLARGRDLSFHGLSAVSAGVRDIRGVVEEARRKGGSILFLDEIHRFNKAQQDALLPHVESGLLVLLGATTENPSFEVISALLSRCRVVTTRPLTPEGLDHLIERALADSERGLGRHRFRIDETARAMLVSGADGDARRLLTALEIAAELTLYTAGAGGAIDAGFVAEAQQTLARRYDKSGEAHFDQISALQKSIRASDAQAAVYWTERMLEAGEDPLYLARRLVRIAVEDVGLAQPEALTQSMAAQQAVHFLGMPEGGLALIQCAIFLALSPKSNRAYRAQRRAAEAIERTGSLPVPMSFRNAPTALLKKLGYGEGYRYDHDYEGGEAGQSGLPSQLEGERFYEPTDRGWEGRVSRPRKRD